MRLIQIELEVRIGLIRKYDIAMLLGWLITLLRKEATILLKALQWKCSQYSSFERGANKRC